MDEYFCEDFLLIKPNIPIIDGREGKIIYTIMTMSILFCLIHTSIPIHTSIQNPYGFITLYNYIYGRIFVFGIGPSICTMSSVTAQAVRRGPLRIVSADEALYKKAICYSFYH